MFKHRFSIFHVLIVVGCLTATSCQRTGEPGAQIVIGETATVSSKHLNKDMTIDIYLPDGYTEGKDRYPVLLTCQSHFLHVGGISADLALKDNTPELIVASVRNYSSDDLIPEKIDGHPDSGGADRFIAFFKDELIPYLDSRYRTQPFRIFYSGSFGGGFCVYMFLTQPSVFNAYLAATPAIDYEGRSTLIMTRAGDYLTANSYENRFLYMGVENEPGLIPVLERFTGILREAEPKGMSWEYHAFLDEDHGSIANKVIYHGLRFVFAGRNMVPEEIVEKGVDAIRSYASALGKKYGHDIGLSAYAVAMAARSYRDQGRLSDVVEALRFRLENNPDSEMTWLQLGRAYEANGELENAKRALETAYQKAKENSSPHLGIFADALDRITRKFN